MKKYEIGERVKVTSSMSTNDFFGMITRYDAFGYDYMVRTDDKMMLPVNEPEIVHSYGSINPSIDLLCAM